MKYTVEIGLDAMIYIPSLIKIGSGILRLIEGIYRHTESKVISLLLFFSNKENGLRSFSAAIPVPSGWSISRSQSQHGDLLYSV
jgi:hypothetical protein